MKEVIIKKMNQKQVERLRKKYPKGTRVYLEEMKDPQAVPLGTSGSVEFVDDSGTIHMHWDNGRGLGLVPGEDVFRIEEKALPYREENVKPYPIDTKLTKGTERMFLTQLEIQNMIILSDEAFDEFKNNMNMDYNFIREYRDHLSKDNGIRISCLLVRSESSKDAIIVQTDETNKAEYYSYFPDARSIFQNIQPENIEEQLYTSAVFHRKDKEINCKGVKIEKIMNLKKDDFEYFIHNMLKKYPFIEANKELMYEGEDGMEHCLLVIGDSTNDGVLIQSEGAGYARKSAFFPNAKQFVKQNHLFSFMEDVYDLEHIQENEIRVLVIEPDKPPYEKVIPNTLEAMQKTIGGHIELITLSDTANILYQEAGKILGLQPNRRFKNDILVGTFMIVGSDGSEDFCSLSPKDVEKYMKRFQEIEEIKPEEVFETCMQVIDFH